MVDLTLRAQNLHDEIVKWRRYFHRYPEVGMDVHQTSRVISHKLRELGLSVRDNVGGAGVVGTLYGTRPGKTVAIRADMDALEVNEETGLAFSSEYPGRMHACGHDAHMSMALAACQVLSEFNSEQGLAGNVKFIFQPAEEGPGGAKAMIDDGALENPQVDAIMGGHIGNIWSLPVGSVGFKEGPIMAATDRFELTVTGKGGHGAMPHETVDAVCLGSEIVSSMQKVVSRRINPIDSAVVTIGKFNSGTAHNVIAEKAYLSGTVRVLNEDIRLSMPSYLEDVISGVTSTLGGTYEFNYVYGYPVVSNNPQFTDFMKNVAGNIFEEGYAVDITEPAMVGEDMSYFLNQVPGTFFFLSSLRDDLSAVYPHHNPRFDLDERVMWRGCALLAETAYKWLSQ